MRKASGYTANYNSMRQIVCRHDTSFQRNWSIVLARPHTEVLSISRTRAKWSEENIRIDLIGFFNSFSIVLWYLYWFLKSESRLENAKPSSINCTRNKILQVFKISSSQFRDGALWICVADLNADYIDMPFGRGGPGTPGMPGSNSRTKRMRTSFKHHQLRTMKSYFAINHNPDAKDLKQLSQKTGLPKRVLQVSGPIRFVISRVPSSFTGWLWCRNSDFLSHFDFISSWCALNSKSGYLLTWL